MFLRSTWNYDRDAASKEAGVVAHDVDPESGEILVGAQQQFKEECDINEIVRRFGLTGQLPDVPRAPVSGDFTGIVDFRTAMEAVRKAEEGFMEFPAELRARFQNDPQQMLQFLGDERNRDEALKLGLIAKPPEVPRDAVKAIDELAAAVRGVPQAASGEATK